MYVVVARYVVRGCPTGAYAEVGTYDTLGKALEAANAVSREGKAWGYAKKPGHKLSFEA